MPASNNSSRMSFDNKFKLKAVELAEQLGNRPAARQLRIDERNIRRWAKEVEAISNAPKNKCCVKARRGAMYPDIDTRVCSFIDEKRNNGLGVSRSLIRLEGLRAAKDLGINEFKASPGWCTRFMKINNYSIRAHTKIAQKLPKEYEDKITNFQRYIIRLRLRAEYTLDCIGNMDETPVNFDMVGNNTVNKRGEKTVLLKTTGHEKCRYTVVLACMADGTKLKPMLIFKRKTMPKFKFPKGVVVHVHPKGWMDEAGCVLWLEKVWGNRPGGIRNKKSLLVWDHFSAHLTQKVSSKVRALNTNIAVIPGGLTGVLQPLDVSMNKPFKSGLRDRWQTWMAEGEMSYTPAGNLKAPRLDILAQWVLESWNDVKAPIVIKSFKKCCISNAMDGTEDDILWENVTPDNEVVTAEQAAAEDLLDEVVQEDDPYDDAIPEAEWEELFNGSHSHEN